MDAISIIPTTEDAGSDSSHAFRVEFASARVN
jgi:hypothetical protein